MEKPSERIEKESYDIHWDNPDMVTVNFTAQKAIKAIATELDRMQEEIDELKKSSNQCNCKNCNEWANTKL